MRLTYDYFLGGFVAALFLCMQLFNIFTFRDDYPFTSVAMFANEPQKIHFINLQLNPPSSFPAWELFAVDRKLRRFLEQTNGDLTLFKEKAPQMIAEDAKLFSRLRNRQLIVKYWKNFNIKNANSPDEEFIIYTF